MNSIPLEPELGHQEFPHDTPLRKRLEALTPISREISLGEMEAATKALTACVIRDSTHYMSWLVLNRESDLGDLHSYTFDAGLAITIALAQVLEHAPINDRLDYAEMLRQAIDSVDNEWFVDAVLDDLRKYLSVRHRKGQK